MTETKQVIGRTIEESTPLWPAQISAKDGSPNVIYWVMDDVGFGHLAPFGGLVETPNLQRIADRGLRYTNFHTTALCSPTRSCLLTGRNHHSNHMAAITEIATAYPSADGYIPFENGFLSEMLAPEGYATWAVGKWHLTPENEGHLAATRIRWPLGRGFERFYGFLGGDSDQYHPELAADNQFVHAPKSPKEGYHLTEDLVDKSIEYMKDLKSLAPSKPFFLYLAFGASHSPHQVAPEWSDAYRGTFDGGWDAYRDAVHKRQLELGTIPAGTALSVRDPDVPEWASLGDHEKQLFAREMEVFAGFTTHMDAEFGRILDFLGSLDELDNTIIIVVSDNGASSEGQRNGTLGFEYQNFIPVSVDDMTARVDEIGTETTFPHYSWGWAWAGNTPFRRWKRETYRGGIADPLVVSWPDGIKSHGEIRTQFAHAIDLVPTVLECAGVKHPHAIKGITQAPIEGTSLAYSFDAGDAPEQHRTQYFEMFSHRSIYHDGWWAVCPWPGPSFAELGRPFGTPLTSDDLRNLEASGWELYDGRNDPAETNNLASREPDRLRELVSLWWLEAGTYGVLPLDGRAQARYFDPKPVSEHAQSRFRVFPGAGPIPNGAAPNVKNRSHTLSAEVDIPDGGAEGILLTHGWRFGGWSFFVKQNRLHYVYNFAGREEFRIVSDQELPAGHCFLSFEFEMTGKPDVRAGQGGSGTGRLYLNRTLIGEGQIPNTMAALYGWGATLACGRSASSPCASDYHDAFPFTGTIHQALIDITGEPFADLEAEAVVAFSRQ